MCNNEMIPEDHERYIRWQDYRITQLSFAINLFLGFAVASLAYAINMKLGNNPHGSVPLESVIMWFSASALLGCFATVSKLLDYRYTAKKIKEGGAFNAFMAEYCGPVTWGCFWSEVLCYAIGAAQFIYGAVVT